MATFFLYLLSLPINAIRLRQMLSLVKKARLSAQGDLSMDWLRPFMSPRKYSKGDVLFHKGDPANEMFMTITGKFLVTEIGIELPPGRMMGELGFVDPKNRRTQTVECIENGDVLTITYEKLLELYFQNPEFGYYFLRLTSERLMQNISRLEGTVEAKNKDIARLEGHLAARKLAFFGSSGFITYFEDAFYLPGNASSKAMFSSRTLTRGSPKIQRLRGVTCFRTRAAICSGGTPRALATRAT